MVRVFRPTLTTCPSRCSICTSDASHAMRRDVSALTRTPSSSDRPPSPCSSSVLISVCTVTWYRSARVPLGVASAASAPSPAASARSATSPAASALRWRLVGRAPGFSPRYSASVAASIARISTAPASGSSRPRTTYVPSASITIDSARRWCRASSAVNSPSRDRCFHPRTIRSSCAAEPWSAYSSSLPSVSLVATRVIARAFE